MIEEIKEGTILVNSWGYDQTQVDFYKVLKVKGKSALVTTLPAVRVADTSWASDNVVAGERVEGSKEALCRILTYGVSLTKLGAKGYSARPWNGKPMHRSWYA